MSTNGEFHIGDRVVYPNHGVGVVEQVGSRTLNGSIEKYYLLNIKSSNLKVTVPFHSVGAVGLRRVVKNGEVVKILEFLSDGESANAADWKDRFKENSDRMRTGSGASRIEKSLIPREEDAGTRPISAGQRTCHVA